MIEMEVKLSSILTSMLLLGLIVSAVKLLNWLWFWPRKLEKLLRKQGLQGNSYRLPLGDMQDLIKVIKAEKSRSIQLSDDLAPHILPYYHQTISKYGENSFIWFGPSPILTIADPQLMKEILTKPDIFHKPRPDPIGDRLTRGLTSLDDEKWAKHRKLINPAFHTEKLKKMVSSMHLSCSNMIEKWESLLSSNSGEIDVWPYLENLTGDVISRTAFGSSHEVGNRILELQREQLKLVVEMMHFFFIPGWRYIPTKKNKRMVSICKEIQSLLRGIIHQKEKAMERGETIRDDLLSTLIESNLKEIDEENGNKTIRLSTEETIEECKLFYFAGSETTSSLLVWTMVMLSKHQEWQARARDEILQVFGKNEPTFDGLNRLKIVTMILHEVLRLYPAVPLLVRTPIKPVKLGNITLPVGVNLMLLIGLLHYDPKIWGDDVNEFKPERFSEGISNAIPFSIGPRVCIGQQFAMIEAKMALVMMLRCFSFEISSSYSHAPFAIITLQPQHGAPLLLHKL